MVCGIMAVCVLVRWDPISSAHWCRVLGLPSTNQVAFCASSGVAQDHVYRRLRNAGAMY
jgi:hypothetical protein